MIMRLAVLVLCLGVVLPAVLGSAAAFSIAPLVSQEVRIPIEEVVTSERLGEPEVSVVSNSGEELTNDDALSVSSETLGETDAPEGLIEVPDEHTGDGQDGSATTEDAPRPVPKVPGMLGSSGNALEPRPTSTPTPLAISLPGRR